MRTNKIVDKIEIIQTKLNAIEVEKQKNSSL